MPVDSNYLQHEGDRISWHGARELKRITSRDGSDDASTVTPDSEVAFDDEEQDLMLHRPRPFSLAQGGTASGSFAALPATLPSGAERQLVTAAVLAQLHRKRMDLEEF